MGSLLNNATLEETINAFRDAKGLEMIFSWFSPGMNIGFVALILLSVAFHEHPQTPMLGILGAYLGTWIWYSSFNVSTFFLHYWLKISVYVVGYVLVGAVWTVPKWWIYVRKSKNRKQLKESYNIMVKTKSRSTEVTDDEKYLAALRIVSNNKFRFYTWMAWWPLSFVFTLTRDPLTILYNWLYARLTSTFAKILLAAFDDNICDDNALDEIPGSPQRSGR